MEDQNPRFPHSRKWAEEARDIIQVFEEMAANSSMSSLRDARQRPSAFSKDFLPRKLPAQPKMGLKRFHPEEAQGEAEDVYKEEEQHKSSEAAKSGGRGKRLAGWSPKLDPAMMPPAKSIKLLPKQGPFAQEESQRRILGGGGVGRGRETSLSSCLKWRQNGYERGKAADRGTKAGEGVVSGIQTHESFLSLAEVKVYRTRAVKEEPRPLSQSESKEEGGDQAEFQSRPPRHESFLQFAPWGQRAGAVLDLSQHNPQSRRAAGALDLTQRRLGGQVALGSLQCKSEGQISDVPLDLSRPRPQVPIAGEAPAFPEYRPQGQLLGGPLDLSRPRLRDQINVDTPDFEQAGLSFVRCHIQRWSNVLLPLLLLLQLLHHLRRV